MLSVYCVVPKWYQVVSTRCIELMSLILLQRLECLLLLRNGVIGKKCDAGLVEGGSLLGRDGYNSSLRPLCRFLATTCRPLGILWRSQDVHLVTFW